MQNQEDMLNLFGKEDQSLNRNLHKSAKINHTYGGESDRVLLMLEVKHSNQSCSSSRNVVFLLDTAAPFTVISPTFNKLILADCALNDFQKNERVVLNINGR